MLHWRDWEFLPGVSRAETKTVTAGRTRARGCAIARLFQGEEREHGPAVVTAVSGAGRVQTPLCPSLVRSLYGRRRSRRRELFVARQLALYGFRLLHVALGSGGRRSCRSGR